MAYDSNNIFAKILRGEIACKKIFENEFVLAFEDIKPDAPVHVLVIPKGQYQSFDDFAANATAAEVAGFFKAVQQVAAQLGVQEEGYRLVLNHGANALQMVPHFHVHLLAGKKLDGLA